MSSAPTSNTRGRWFPVSLHTWAIARVRLTPDDWTEQARGEDLRFWEALVRYGLPHPLTGERLEYMPSNKELADTWGCNHKTVGRLKDLDTGRPSWADPAFLDDPIPSAPARGGRTKGQRRQVKPVEDTTTLPNDAEATPEGLPRDCQGIAEGLPRDCQGTDETDVSREEGLPRDCQGIAEGLPRDCFTRTEEADRAPQDIPQVHDTTPPAPLGGNGRSGRKSRSSKPTPSSSKRYTLEAVQAHQLPPVLADLPGFADAWRDWTRIRWKQSRWSEPQQIDRLLAKLTTYHRDGLPVVEGLVRGYERGWQGISRAALEYLARQQQRSAAPPQAPLFSSSTPTTPGTVTPEQAWDAVIRAMRKGKTPLEGYPFIPDDAAASNAIWLALSLGDQITSWHDLKQRSEEDLNRYVSGPFKRRFCSCHAGYGDRMTTHQPPRHGYHSAATH